MVIGSRVFGTIAAMVRYISFVVKEFLLFVQVLSFVVCRDFLELMKMVRMFKELAQSWFFKRLLTILESKMLRIGRFVKLILYMTVWTVRV